MTLIKLKFPFIILILVALTNLIEAAEPGSPCTVATGSEDCEEAFTFLYCEPNTVGPEQGTCQCNTNTTVVEDKICKSLINKDCSVNGVGKPHCSNVQHLICSAKNKCECQPDSVNVGGVCKSIFGASCNIAVNDPECDETSYLTCGPGAVCVCQAGHEQIMFQNKCRANLDDSCTGTSTACDHLQFLSCSTSTEKCECRNGTNLVNNVCVAQMNQNCSSSGTGEPICDDSFFLECNNKKCECKVGTLLNNGECRAFEGQQCKVPDVAPDCATNSFLACNEAVSPPICECEPGHEKNKLSGDKCVTTTYGETCPGEGAVCNPTLYHSCDQQSNNCLCREDTHTDDGDICSALLGQRCNPHGHPIPNCSKDLFLSCVNNTFIFTCQCPEDSTVVKGLCTALLGQPCDLPETPSCAGESHLICNGENKCECDADHAELDGLCTLQMNEACGEVGTICDPDQLLDCIPTGLNPVPKCKCRDGTELIDNQCKVVVPPGVGLGKLCNATVGPFCIENSHLICGSKSKVCECEPHHDPYGGKCKVNYQESCPVDSMVVCDPSQFLTCGTTGNCECRNGTQFFDGTCRANMNQICSTIGLINPKCMDSDFLTCGSKSQCECRPGTTRVDDKCMAMVGQPCDDNGVANPNCDSEQQMACRNETCICLEPFVDDGKGKCRVKFGGPCTDDLPCDAGRLLTCNLGQCQCMTNRTEVQGTCRGILNDQCDGTERVCDGEKGLKCNVMTQRCACLDDYVINPDLQTCSGAGGLLTNFSILVTLVMVVCWSSINH